MIGKLLSENFCGNLENYTPDSDFTTVVHEMRHAFDNDQRKMADSVGKSGTKASSRF
jgi:hypothetical protein